MTSFIKRKNKIGFIILFVITSFYEKFKNVFSEQIESTIISRHDEERNNAVAGVMILTILILVSILFEMATEKLNEETDEMNKPFINSIFSELTTLGFIGLLLFVVTRMDILRKISTKYFGEPQKLQETIEILHMCLFMFIIIFLILCCVLLRLGIQVQDEWRHFERRATNISTIISDYCLSIEANKSFLDYFNIKKHLQYRKCSREMTYVSLRRRFADPRANHPSNTITEMDQWNCSPQEYQVNPNIQFPFNEYLSIISGEVLGRLIEIDVITWIALEIIMVTFWLFCSQLSPISERYLLLFSGFGLILLNHYVYKCIFFMRNKVTSKKLFLKAKRLQNKPKWRKHHNLTITDLHEKSNLLKTTIEIKETDSIPDFIKELPTGGIHMTIDELKDAQRSLIFKGNYGGNGVLFAMFSTRMVFLLTAVHLSVFLVRSASEIYHNCSAFSIFIFYILFLIPSTVVSFMATRIARDGLYAFNVEFLKVQRVIIKVMRLLKARQTLRTLRFVAEMKIYLKEDRKRDSVIIMDQRSFQDELAKAEARGNNKLTKQRSQSRRRASITSPLMSPISPQKAHRINKRKNDAYEKELERREINSIFAVFDTDGSGAISHTEMKSLLQGITHEMTEEQINRIMLELDTTKSGDITFDDFYNWCHSRIREYKHSPEELLEEVFRMIDTDNSGEITADEFISIFKTLGQSLDHDDVRELVYQMDQDDDGKINLEEFSRMLKKHAV